MLELRHEAGSLLREQRNQTGINAIIHHFGLDVHKESIAVSIAPAHSTEVRRYGIIGSTLDAVDTPLRKLTAMFPHLIM